MNGAGKFDLFWGEITPRVFAELLPKDQDAVQRRAQFVRHQAQEGAAPGVQGGAAVGVGLGYRYNDAIIPNIELRYQKLVIGILYDVNISTISASGVARDGVELALRMDF